MKVMGCLQVRLREAPDHVPAHLDVIAGACEAAGRLDGGPLDRAIRKRGHGFRASVVFPSRRSLLRTGEQHLDYDDTEHELGLSRTMRIELADRGSTAAVADDLRELEKVEVVREETVATTLSASGSEMDRQDPDHAREMVRAFDALAQESGDERVVVAVLDTGVSLGHPELRRKLMAGYDTVDIRGAIEGLELVGDTRGRDFNPRDDVGHGSHIAGVIGAQGFRIPRGVAGRSLVVPVRVLAAALSNQRRVGVGGLSDIDCGIKVACDLGAKVMNLSFGTPESNASRDAPPHQEVVRYAVQHGCILVVAMGNSGKREKYYPAALPEVLAVGSVDDDAQPSSFSTRGDHVALVAPGEQVMSIGLRGCRRATGTSHAAPFVTGAAALLVARARRRGHDLSPAAARWLLTASARRLPADREAVGAGLLDMAAAIRMLDDGGLV